MRAFIGKLAVWHRLVKDLQYARLRLAQVEAAQPRGSRVWGLQEDVRCLERACDQALAELQVAADAYRAALRQQTDLTPVDSTHVAWFGPSEVSAGEQGSMYLDPATIQRKGTHALSGH